MGKLKKAWNQGLLKILPKELVYRAQRRLIKLPLNPQQNLSYKVAESEDELRQAFYLIYKNYEREGFTQKNSAQVRLTKYHLLPSTQVLIAKRGDRVVGTLSVMAQSFMGLPSAELLNDPSPIELEGQMAEISCLAIAKDQAGQGGAILWSLIHYLYYLSRHHMNLDFWFISFHPRFKPLYEGLLGFTILDNGGVVDYGMANNSPALLALLDLNLAPTLWKRMYSGSKEGSQLGKFLSQGRRKDFSLPTQGNSTHRLGAEFLREFFMEKSQVIQTLKEQEKFTLRKVFGSSWPEWPQVELLSRYQRKAPRIEVQFWGEVYTPEGTQWVRVNSLSSEGLGFMSHGNWDIGSHLTIRLHTNEGQTLYCQAQVSWKSDNMYGGRATFSCSEVFTGTRSEAHQALG